MSKTSKNKLSPIQAKELLATLKNRFEKNTVRHKEITWDNVQSKLESLPDKLWILDSMETTGGEPDVVGYDKKKNEFIFFDCAAESPKGRRSICYDPDALEARKEYKPAHSAIGLAAEMGIEILTEEQYHFLQSLGDYDTKTSSWLQTPVAIRKLGGAIFGDKRYKHVFIYHNGVESYYAGRAFRGCLKV